MGLYTLNKAKINSDLKKRFIVVEDFYENPQYVREFALRQFFHSGGLGKGYMGNRTGDFFFAPDMKDVLESIIGKKINNWYDGDYCNGVFQHCCKDDRLVYHCDEQDWAGAIYLNPDAPHKAGTSFYASKRNGQRGGAGCELDEEVVFAGDFNSPEKDENPFLNPNLYEKVDEVGNIYNRLVLFDAHLIHAASEYFGETPENSRLFHLFFFNVER